MTEGRIEAVSVRQELGLGGSIWPGVSVGFGAAVAMWLVWYPLHLPGLRVPPVVAGPLLLLVLVAMIARGSRHAGGRAIAVGALAGLVSAGVNLLLLGNQLTEAGANPEDAANAQFRPSAGLIVGGFVVLSLVAGVIGGLIGRKLGRGLTPRRDWVAPFGVTAVVAMLPLVAAGGAVTSAGAGMAVPDWPGTYGSNMFLYPIGLMADPRIYLEHTHRLFGTLVGLTTLVLMVAVMCSRSGWKWLALVLPLVLAAVGITIASNLGHVDKALSVPVLGFITVVFGSLMLSAIFLSRSAMLAAGVFSLVCIQGMLGAIRVTDINPGFGIVHGVLAQFILCGAAILAASLTGAWKDRLSVNVELARKGRTWTGVALAALFVQLVLAAMYRHLGSAHALLTHMGFAVIAAGLVLVAAFSLIRTARDSGGNGTLRRLGVFLMHGVTLQVALGIAAFFLLSDGGEDRVVMHDELGAAPEIPVAGVLVATTHQLIGAGLLMTAALGAAWLRRVKADPQSR